VKGGKKVVIQDKSNDIKDLEISWPVSNDLPALGYENQRKLYKDLKKTKTILKVILYHLKKMMKKNQDS